MRLARLITGKNQGRGMREFLSYIIRSEIDLGIGEEDSLEYT